MNSFTTGPGNQLLSDGTYTYDNAEGNRIAKFIDANGNGVLDAGDTSITQYSWDARDRLTEVRSYADYSALAANTPTQVVDYLYDVENRWIGENIFTSGGEHETRFAYDGNQIVLEFDKDISSPLPPGEGQGEGEVLTVSDLSHRYVWQPNAVDQLMADEHVHLDANGNIATAELLFALTDQQGTVHDLAKLNTSTGATAVVDHIIRDSFGKVVSESNPAEGCLIGWTGRPFDPATGLSAGGQNQPGGRNEKQPF